MPFFNSASERRTLSEHPTFTRGSAKFHSRVQFEGAASDQLNNGRGPWKELYTGTKFYPLDFTTNQIKIEDMAHSAAGLARYGAHAKRSPEGWVYSVGQHELELMWYTRDVLKYNYRCQMNALMHDKAETFLGGDFPSPLKKAFPDIKVAETYIEEVLMPFLGLPVAKPKWLNEIDKRIVHNEREAFMVDNSNNWETDGALPVGLTKLDIPPMKIMHPDVVEKVILEEYDHLDWILAE